MDLKLTLLDDIPNESGALAQVALGAGNASLLDTSSGLLYFRKKALFNPVSESNIFVWKRSPSSATASSLRKRERNQDILGFPTAKFSFFVLLSPQEGDDAEILQEVRRT